MTFHKALVLMGMASVLGAAPAFGADWGGIKDMGGGVPVPVPAPAPVPTFDADSDWYVGLAIGANLSQDATISDSYPNMPMKDSSDIGASPIFGLSFGRYITPSLRAEIAVDYTPDAKITRDGTLEYTATASAPAISPRTGFDTDTYDILRSDTVKLSRTTALVNFIYDIHTGTRFTPYVGAGFGFTWRKLRRSYSELSGCVSAVNSDGLLPTDCTTNPNLPVGFSQSGSSTKEQFDFAGAVQAGLAYDINDWITWDNGWQMLWEGNAISSSEPGIAGANVITYKDSILQQFRSGIRLKFN